ncbi:hypothetical protein [Thiomicrorhabdus aquaedulcis]|uniref:hypothetical protein n=1 Tax=Thiomicrorhabdus aquaedulcis TaxID=2211106 RepID=UPI000FD93DFE|nr:hypothetical protein [Thiomicrorhabdus aquaedulcis]
MNVNLTAQSLKKQHGSISILGALSIVLALSTAGTMIEYGNAKLLDRELDNYARDVAAVALRSELAITKNMKDRAITDATVSSILNTAAFSLPNPEDSGAAFDLEKKITFGNIVNNQFIPLETYASNPKASDEFIEFSAVAVELWSEAKGFSVIPGTPRIFIPSGKAIYGLSQESVESPDIAACFCDKRYEMCLVSDMAGVPASFPGSVGAVGSPARKNYCEYGHVDSHPANVNKTKYPSVPLAPQWIGKDRSGNEILVDTSTVLPDAFSKVLNHEPLKVNKGDDPFSKNYWDFWMLKWFFGGNNYYVRDWDGTTLKRSDSYDNGYEYSGDYFYDGWDKKIMVHGYFYVGRKGTCVMGTTAANVPNISGGLANINNVASSTSASEVVRCLSYEKTVGTTSVTKSCGFNPACWFSNPFGTYETTANVTGYAQQSCIDFNSNEKTRMNFFQWMMSLFFSPFTDVDTSYKQLDCSIQKMRYFSIKIPFLGGGFTWQIQ